MPKQVKFDRAIVIDLSFMNETNKVRLRSETKPRPDTKGEGFNTVFFNNSIKYCD